MPTYVKAAGIWAPIDRPFVHANGVYVPVKTGYVKNAGTWKVAYNYDIDPPPAPVVSLQLIENRNSAGTLTGRYIKVGIRGSSANNDPDLAFIRVLSTHLGGPPTNFAGGTFTTTPDENYPGEPWSEWRYNPGKHDDTSVVHYKQFPPNANNTTDIQNDKTYYFTAWSCDTSGNWSGPTAAEIKVPKAAVEATQSVSKEGRFYANETGSWHRAQTGFVAGKPVARNSPESQGLWFYGNQFTDNIGKIGTPTFTNAMIYLKRETDNGANNAHIYLGWNGYRSSGELPGKNNALTWNEITYVGDLAKGQGSWFMLPVGWRGNLNHSIKNIGTYHKDPAKAGVAPADFSVMEQVTSNVNSGQVYITWTEKP